MANKKISALTAITSLDTGDVFPVVDVSVPETKKITRENLALDLQTLMPVLPIANAAGTVDAITADYTPNITLSDRRLCAFIATGANTSTTPSFAPDGLTAHTIVKMGGQALAAGDIPGAEAVCILQYDLTNTRWELLNPTVFVSDAAYGAGWNGATTIAPSKNAVYDSLMAKTGENLAIGADADGDMYYRAASVLARLAKGPINHTLRMNDAGTAPEWKAIAAGQPFNLRISPQVTVNILDIFAKTSGADPDASNVIGVAIPDGTGNEFRTRDAAYLSGTSQITLADATNYWAGLVSIGAADTQFDITNPTGVIARYTYDATGTDPGLAVLFPRVGDVLKIAAENFNAANNGTFVVTAAATTTGKWVEISNAAVVAENDKTIGSGSFKVSPLKSASGVVHWAYVYAIWDGTGIVWALAGHPFHQKVTASTEPEESDFMLLEDSSTYTRDTAHYCRCVGRIPYTYFTGDAPDHTILNTGTTVPYVGYYGENRSGIIQRYVERTQLIDSTAVALPLDATLPAITEGKPITTRSFTPRRVGSRVVVQMAGCVYMATQHGAAVALFKDGTCVCVGGENFATYQPTSLLLMYDFKTTSLAPIKFHFRYGTVSGGTAYFNSPAGTQYYSTGANGNVITITEYDDSL